VTVVEVSEGSACNRACLTGFLDGWVKGLVSWLSRLDDERGRHHGCASDRVPPGWISMRFRRQRPIEWRFHKGLDLEPCPDHLRDERS
jgi:hypothetical protein